jgi:DNA-binding CsgD family transcriptional regulator
MARSTRAKLSDVAALLHIAGEAAELPRRAVERRMHVLDRLAALCGADKGVYAQFDRSGPGQTWDIRPADTLFHQTPLSELRKVDFFYVERRPRDPVMDRMSLDPAKVVVVTPYDYFEATVWERSEHYNEVRRPSQIEAQLYSHFRCGAFTHGIGLHRRSRHAFERRELQLITLFLQKAGTLIASPPSLREERISKLPPRLRPVLQSFLTGDSEKEAAARLGLTLHTVHTYAKQLYRLLGVSSRAELMALFVEPGDG